MRKWAVVPLLKGRFWREPDVGGAATGPKQSLRCALVRFAVLPPVQRILSKCVGEIVCCDVQRFG
jgi:hypothetical protein